VPRVRPLTPDEAKKTLANRFGGRADRLRQLNTKFGIRPHRVFLVWTEWVADESGEGGEKILSRVELLPTPKVSDLSAIQRRAFLQGALPDGSLRVEEISVDRYTEDNLKGLVIPSDVPGQPGRPVNPNGVERNTKGNISFFYEVVEDGRGDNPAARQRFNLNGYPSRAASRVQFIIYLVRESQDMDRRGQPTLAGASVDVVPGFVDVGSGEDD
jgi:hypothetical protein